MTYFGGKAAAAKGGQQGHCQKECESGCDDDEGYFLLDFVVVEVSVDFVIPVDVGGWEPEDAIPVILGPFIAEGASCLNSKVLAMCRPTRRMVRIRTSPYPFF